MYIVRLSSIVLINSCVQLKELNHNNIKAFIGACVDSGHICYLMQACNRGTVQVTLHWRWKRVYSSIMLQLSTLC